MIQLNSKKLHASSIKHLKNVQKQILNEPSFEAKVIKASSRWDGKTSGAGNAVFKEIKDKLLQMTVGVEVCVYCEQNEATDIEHIYPKKLFPEKAFAWDNYILACSKCNTHHKSDKFKIFNPQNSSTEEDVTAARGKYIQPANYDSLFINQRKENPMEYLELDLVNKQFIFTERHPNNSREYKKAKYTKDLLGLNTRATLVVNRKNAVKFYISRLEKYVAAKIATSFVELINAINDDWGGIDQNMSFNNEKARILASIKIDILTYSHPTVWKELIRQKENLPKTNLLFTQAPEAINW